MLGDILEPCRTWGLCDIDGLCSPGINCLLLGDCVVVGAMYYQRAVVWVSCGAGDGVVLGLVCCGDVMGMLGICVFLGSLCCCIWDSVL